MLLPWVGQDAIVIAWMIRECWSWPGRREVFRAVRGQVPGDLTGDCTWHAAGMPGPWSLLSLGTALMYALAERISRMPGPAEHSAQQPAPIIGREAGLARLRGLVDPAPLSSQVLLVTGEAGMGKTVLLADAAARARRAGMRVLPVTSRE